VLLMSRPAPKAGGEPVSVIRLDHVTKRYRPEDLPAVDRLTLEVEHGEILVLLGPSGCGKTTTLRLIAGFERADAGKIEIAGTLVADGPWGLPPEQRGAGMVFQDYALFPHLTMEANIGFGLLGLEPKARAERIQEVLALVGLKRLAGRFPHELSGGQQQRVALGRALAPRPAVLLLDEPLSNLDADMRAQVRQDLHMILRQTGSTTLFVTHDQEEAFMIADRVGVLNGGHLEQLDRPEEIYHLPATRFVAHFVGKADFLPGTVTEEGIVTEIGILPNRPGFPVGTKVEVMIRPDDIDLIPDVEGNAIVVSRQFRGADNLFSVSLPSGTMLHSNQASTLYLEPRSRVRVVALPTHIVAFPAITPWI